MTEPTDPPRGRRDTVPSVGTLVARNLPRREPLFDDAPCVGKWYTTDMPTDLRLSARAAVVEHFAHALSMCAACPLTEACRTRVAPKESYYDGVCAGVVYRNGRAIGGLAGVIPSGRVA